MSQDIYCLIFLWSTSSLLVDDEDSSSSGEEDEEVASVTEMKMQLQEKPTSDKVSTTKETEAVAEISALVNYVQPVHFTSFEVSESKYKNNECNEIFFTVNKVISSVIYQFL